MPSHEATPEADNVVYLAGRTRGHPARQPAPGKGVVRALLAPPRRETPTRPPVTAEAGKGGVLTATFNPEMAAKIERAAKCSGLDTAEYLRRIAQRSFDSTDLELDGLEGPLYRTPRLQIDYSDYNPLSNDVLLPGICEID